MVGVGVVGVDIGVVVGVGVVVGNDVVVGVVVVGTVGGGVLRVGVVVDIVGGCDVGGRHWLLMRGCQCVVLIAKKITIFIYKVYVSIVMHKKEKTGRCSRGG